MYDHYIAIDWAKNNMAIARTAEKSNKIKVIESPSDLTGIKEWYGSQVTLSG